ncbi:unnamed protein product [Tilletia controversa]|uniref:PAS domain-containing protein n=3 Tax=Tilletia TaxID=13289 RepID=A0A8X7MMA1_9BASI|nr:hypothetical protein CF336_g7096 [Tilletia laevis]KAE8187031.1 hypothetical protein CF328_g7043 [Tilletia controversa]KAE8248530.1 hypothetical protein A4X03_0g6757 [Tilletia caries]KAE8188841.1 hypothetical protein CF335_g6778 [Tilletia laevis]KAE8241205.1 hypothetical protein A4X06_0g7624 [Tilletia controversa]
MEEARFSMAEAAQREQIRESRKQLLLLYPDGFYPAGKTSSFISKRRARDDDEDSNEGDDSEGEDDDDDDEDGGGDAEEVDQLGNAPPTYDRSSASSSIAASTAIASVAGPSHPQPQAQEASSSRIPATAVDAVQGPAEAAREDDAGRKPSALSEPQKITYGPLKELQHTNARAYRGPLPAQTVLNLLLKPSLSDPARRALTGYNKGTNLEYLHFLGMFPVPVASRRGRKFSSATTTRRRNAADEETYEFERWQCRCCHVHLHVRPRNVSNLLAHLMGTSKQLGCFAKRYESAVEELREPPKEVMERLVQAQTQVGTLVGRKRGRGKREGSSNLSASGSGTGLQEDTALLVSASVSASASASGSNSPVANRPKRKDPPLWERDSGEGPAPKRTAGYDSSLNTKTPLPRLLSSLPFPPPSVLPNRAWIISTSSSPVTSFPAPAPAVAQGSGHSLTHLRPLPGEQDDVVIPFGAPAVLPSTHDGVVLQSSSSSSDNGPELTYNTCLPPPLFPHLARNPTFSIASTANPSSLVILTSNPTLGLLTGYNPREVLVGVRLSEMIAPEDGVFLERMARDVLSFALIRAEVEGETSSRVETESGSGSGSGSGRRATLSPAEVELPPDWVERTLNPTAQAQMQLRVRHAYGFFDAYLVRVHVGPLPGFVVQDPRTHRGAVLVWTFLKMGNVQAGMPALQVA